MSWISAVAGRQRRSEIPRRCARTFTHDNLLLLEVHHNNGNHDDNPQDGSNWGLLGTCCHEHEHSKIKDAAGRTADGAAWFDSVMR